MFTALWIKKTRFFGIRVYQVWDGGNCLTYHLTYDGADNWRQNIFDYEAKYAATVSRHPAGKDLGPRS